MRASRNGLKMINLTITTAIELSEEQKLECEKKLAEKYGKFRAVYRVNDSLIGGIIIFDGDKVYDGSISTQLKKIKEKLSN